MRRYEQTSNNGGDHRGDRRDRRDRGDRNDQRNDLASSSSAGTRELYRRRSVDHSPPPAYGADQRPSTPELDRALIETLEQRAIVERRIQARKNQLAEAEKALGKAEKSRFSSLRNGEIRKLSREIRSLQRLIEKDKKALNDPNDPNRLQQNQIVAEQRRRFEQEE